MDLESIIHSEINQTEKDKYSVLSLMCGTHKKEMNITKQKQTHRCRKQTNGERGARGARWEYGTKRYKPLCIK